MANEVYPSRVGDDFSARYCCKLYQNNIVLHGLIFVVVFEVLCGIGGGEILILRQGNLGKQCLCRFLLSKYYDFACGTYSIIRKIDILLDSQYTGNKRVSRAENIK